MSHITNPPADTESADHAEMLRMYADYTPEWTESRGEVFFWAVLDLLAGKGITAGLVEAGALLAAAGLAIEFVRMAFLAGGLK